MNDNTTNDERFKTISGISYETKIKELYDICKEKERNNEDNKEDIKNLIEVDEEYKEWKQWAKKEVKRRVARVWGKTKKMNVS
jgi:hypothetical protein